MAMRELLRLARPLVLSVQHSSISLQSSLPLAGSASAYLGGQRQLTNHSGRLTNPWEEVLRVAKGNPEKLREIVDTLTNHCIKAQAAPPLDQYNELLRICEMHSDLSSVHKLCQMACAVRMHLDHTTFDRLQACYAYFPKPYPSTAAKGSFAGRDGLGPSTAQHATAASSSSSSSEAGVSSSEGSSSRGVVRTGAISEVPATSNIPSISATGGASSVSASSSSSSSSSSSFARAGGRISTTQTNVWVATTGVTSTHLQALQREREQVAVNSSRANNSSSGGSGGASSSSGGVGEEAPATSTAVNGPDAAA